MTLDFDFIQWLLGPPAEVAATAVSIASAEPGEICALLRYGPACTATVTASGIMPRGLPFSIGFRVLFEKGLFELKTVFEGEGPPNNNFHFYSDTGVRKLAIEEHDPYEQELRYFIKAVRGEVDTRLLDASHATAALKLSLATLQSIRESRAISLVNA
jgi:predicted dehydrogenase